MNEPRILVLAGKEDARVMYFHYQALNIEKIWKTFIRDNIYMYIYTYIIYI